jgi:2-C-methyl-D-erythritol 4-phosphate cytidylyltransferase/2-C-methyl-D-erythritol 2,4-cyclodiphosphate synthase
VQTKADGRRISALIVAAGRGTRAGRAPPKQYARLGRETVLGRAVGAFLRQDAVSAITVVIAGGDQAAYEEAMRGLEGGDRLRPPVIGGGSRQESVLAGLKSLEASAPDVVLIHDGARPFVTAGLIGRVAAAVSESAGAIPALAVTDTLKRLDGGFAAETVDRHALVGVQTPQGFPFALLLAAYQSLGPEALAAFTDDAGIAAGAGLAVRVVEGEAENVKITRPGDLERARARLVRAAVPHVGLGFDVHAFGPGDGVTLCGVDIAHWRGLKGHSDADVGLHALTDAIYGALAEGDIGHHFPPSDPKWRGADSAVFLTHAAERVVARGGRLTHVDVTLICETPKIGPHRDAMQARVAALLGLPPASVGIKATTTERLGFAGRGEGIAAQAVATVLLPEADGDESHG